jgi:glutamine synthetase
VKDKPAVREARYFMKDHPEIGVIELLQPDMNGILRGKRIGTDDLDKACDPGINMCAATTMLDVKGQTNMNVIYGSQDGDPDVYAPIVPGTLTPVPWSGRPIGQALMSLRSPDGADRKSVV